MTISLVGTDKDYDDVSNITDDINLTYPAGVVDGDIAIIVTRARREDQTYVHNLLTESYTNYRVDGFDTPGNFESQTAIWWKELVSADAGNAVRSGGLNYTSAVVGRECGMLFVLRGVDLTTPITRAVMVSRNRGLLSDGQTEVDYTTFSGGTGWIAGDVGETITLEDTSVVTIDAVTTGAVTEFTIDSTTADFGYEDTMTVDQVSTTGTGTGFQLTVGTGQTNIGDGLNSNIPSLYPHPARILTDFDNQGVILISFWSNTHGYQDYGKPANTNFSDPISSYPTPFNWGDTNQEAQMDGCWDVDVGLAGMQAYTHASNDYTHTPNTSLTEGQDETNYDGAGSNGTWVGGDGAGGTAYVVSDTITLDTGVIITVDAIDGNDDVTQFTVTTADNNDDHAADGVQRTQASTSGTGTGFTITPGTNNLSTETSPNHRLYSIAIKAAPGPVITDVDTDEAWVDGDTGLVITGTGFV